MFLRRSTGYAATFRLRLRLVYNNVMRSQVESLLLSEVKLPGQYIGGELGSIVKSKDSVKGRLCLAFPDVYTIGG